MYVCMGTRICDDSFLATIYVFTRLYMKPKLVLKYKRYEHKQGIISCSAGMPCSICTIDLIHKVSSAVSSQLLISVGNNRVRVFKHCGILLILIVAR